MIPDHFKITSKGFENSFMRWLNLRKEQVNRVKFQIKLNKDVNRGSYP